MPRTLNRTGFGLAFKLSVLILLSTSAVFFAAFAFNYVVSRRIVLRTVEDNAGNLACATANHIEEILARIEAVPDFASRTLTDMPLEAGRIETFVRNVVETNPAIYGSTIAFEPKAFDGERLYFAPYAFRSGNDIAMTYLGNDDYQYHHLDWYVIPKESGRAVWSEPYFDEGGGNIAMATYSAPFYRNVNGESRFTGVVTVDIALDWLREIMTGVRIFDSGYAFILSEKGNFIYHPNNDYVMSESIFSLAEKKDVSEWQQVGRVMLGGGKGFIRCQGTEFGTPSWLYHVPLASTKWALGVTFPDEELFGDIRHLAYRVAAIGLSGFGVLFLLVVFVAVRITGPLRVLSSTAAEIAKGHLDVPLPAARSKDEVGELSHSFENMRTALQEYICNLTETTAAKERIESELKIAHSIQMSFLPRLFPPFPDRPEFRLHAALEPAKEVGGDLYDYFLVEGNYLFFTIGDVTDKGVPAALFMAVTKTLMKGIALQALDPSAVLAAVNNELCQGNDANLFVTVFCGCLDFRTGELRYSNAGHNPPVLVHPDGTVEWIALPPGMVLGVMENNPYETRIRQMAPGARLIAYTDGVTEAMDERQEQYSDERLFEWVCRNGLQSPKAIVTGILESVHEYASGAPQSDDITVLAIEYSGE